MMFMYNKTMVKEAKRIKRSQADVQIPSAQPLKRARQRQRSEFRQPTWQNPLLEYWASKRPRRRPKRHRSRRARVELQILIMLACFSISVGLWENFRQLWLQKNGFTATEISNITSLGTIFTVIGVIVVAKTVDVPRMKRFMSIALIARSINMLLMFLLNSSGLRFLVDLCIILDILTTSLVFTGVYPLITTAMKSNSAYSRRKLVEYLFRDVGVFIGGIFIGQHIGSFLIDYNVCLMIALVFSVVTTIIMVRIQIIITERMPISKFSMVKYILKNKIQRLYMIFAFLGNVAWSTATGLKMLMLTDYFDFSASMATTYLLVLGLLSDLVGILALRYFTPKNDYITIWLKFGIRVIAFAFALTTGNIFVCFLALTWALLSSTAYENITDGYYINAIDNRHQLQYNSFKHVVNYLGDAVGIFLCGQMLQYGAQYVFGLSALICIPQIILALYLVYLRNKQKRFRKFSRRQAN